MNRQWLIICFLILGALTGYSQTKIIFSKSSGKLNSGSTLDLMTYNYPDGSLNLLMKGSVSRRGEYDITTSTNGNHIVFNTYRFGGWKLGIGQLKDGTIRGIRKLTEKSNYEYEAQYSPDGSQIAYQEYNWGKRDYDIFIVNEKGKNANHFIASPGNDRTPHWSADGKAIIFTSSRDGSYNLYSKSILNNELHQITSGESNNFAPSVSKKSNKIAYLSDSGGKLNLFTINMDGSDNTNITSNFDFGKFIMRGFEDSGCWAMKTCWSPDGKQIVFSVPFEGDFELFVINSDGTGLQQITNNNDTDINPHWVEND